MASYSETHHDKTYASRDHGRPTRQGKRKGELWTLIGAAVFILLCLLTAIELFGGSEYATGTETRNPPPHSIAQ